MRKTEQIFESDDPYLRWLKKSRGLSKTTVWHYYTYYKDFIKFDPTQENINKFLQSKNNNNVARAFMNSFFDYLKSEKIDHNFELPPAKKTKSKKRIVRDLSPQQINQIRKVSYQRKLRDGLIFDIIYYGALRRKEIIPIKISDFGWSDWFKDPTKYCTLKILGKGAKEREVLIPPKVIKILLNLYLEKEIINAKMDTNQILDVLNSNKSFVFKDLYERDIHRRIRKNSLKAIGIAIRPHELRHTMATEMENKNINIRDIQHYLGHTRPQITEIYLHTTQKRSIKNIRGILDG